MKVTALVYRNIDPEVIHLWVNPPSRDSLGVILAKHGLQGDELEETIKEVLDKDCFDYFLCLWEVEEN